MICKGLVHFPPTLLLSLGMSCRAPQGKIIPMVLAIMATHTGEPGVQSWGLRALAGLAQDENNAMLVRALGSGHLRVVEHVLPVVSFLSLTGSHFSSIAALARRNAIDPSASAHAEAGHVERERCTLYAVPHKVALPRKARTANRHGDR